MSIIILFTHMLFWDVGELRNKACFSLSHLFNVIIVVGGVFQDLFKAIII